MSVCYIGDGETQIARSSTDVVQDMGIHDIGESHQVPTWMNQSTLPAVNPARALTAFASTRDRPSRAP